MSLLDVREAQELGPLGDSAWEAEPNFKGKSITQPVQGDYETRRPQEAEAALADVHAIIEKIESGEI